jgi:hypothetical protein
MVNPAVCCGSFRAIAKTRGAQIKIIEIARRGMTEVAGNTRRCQFDKLPKSH